MRGSMRYFLTLCLIFVLTIAENYAQTSMPYGYAGRRFIVGFMQNELITESGDTDKGLIQIIGISTTELSKVEVENYLTNELRTYIIPKDSVLWVQVPRNNENFDSEVGRMKGIEIRSDRPVTVSCLSSLKFSSDAYLAMPTIHWGREYVVVSMPNTTWAHDEFVRTGEFLIIGGEDNTLVTYTTTAKTMKDTAVGQPVYIRLNKGETYLVRSTDKELEGNDLTGTFIRSDKPIGVLSGHVRTCVPTRIVGEKYDSRNHLVEMLTPTSLWGMNYVTIPFTIPSPDPDIFKVVAYEPNTTVSVTGKMTNTTFTLTDAGSFNTLGPFSEPLIWSSDKPISIAQFMPTSQDPKNSVFDPAMIMIPPVTTFMQEAVFRAFHYSREIFSTHLVTIICDSIARDNLLYDGTLVKDLYPSIMNNHIPDTRYYFINFRITEGTHRLVTKEGRFSGTVYGLGNDDAYAFTLGGELIPTNNRESVPPEINANNGCGIVTGYVYEPSPAEGSYIRDVRVALDSTINYSWKIGTISDTSTFVTFRAEPVNPSKNGLFVLEAIDNMGNKRRYRSVFKALDINFDDTVKYLVRAGKKECRVIRFTNTGKTGLTIGGGTLINDPRLSFGPSNPNGVTYQILAPTKSIDIEICFDPGKDTNNLNAVFQMNLPCNLQMTTRLIGRNLYSELAAIHHDFGNIVVGDTICSQVHFVSKGNLPITISKVQFPVYKHLTLDTNGLFPVTLNTGDSLTIPVCYLPHDRTQDSIAIFPIHNQPDMPVVYAIVEGKGIAPNILTKKYVFDARRIGTRSNDTIIEIINDGNMKGDLSLLLKKGDTASFKENTRIIFPTTIQPHDTLRFSTSFYPDSVRLYQTEFEWKITNWKLHPNVSTTLSGGGTLPTITTFNYDFDTVKLYQGVQKNITLFVTGGNESLTVDTLIWGEGDISAFSIPQMDSYQKKYPVGSSVDIPITFTPRKIGTSRATLYIVNDALSAHKRKTDTVYITGYAKKSDTIRATMTAVVPEIVAACADTVFTVSVINTGNVPIVIDSLYFSSSLFSITRLKNVSIDSGKIVDEIIPISSMPYSGLPYELVLSANNGSVTEKKSGIVSAIQQEQFVSVSSDTVVATIGNNYSVHYSGDISLKENGLSGDLRISFTHDPDVFYLKNTQEITITLTEDGANKTYTLPFIEQGYGKYTVLLSLDKVSAKDISWKMTAQYLVLLSEKKTAPFNLYVENTPLKCIEQDSSSLNISVSPVCADDMRTISFDPAPIFRLYQVRPHPVNEKSELFIVLPDNASLEVEILNTFGEVCSQSKVQGVKGFNTIPFLFSTFKSGYYLIKVQCQYGTQTLPFIIQ